MTTADRSPAEAVRVVAVGSTNPVKLVAARRAVARVWPAAVVIATDVQSGVAHQPLSADEAMAGALNRASGAIASTGADIGIGIEGNVEETAHGMFSTAWVAVVNTQGAYGLGSSGRFMLPEGVAQRIRAGGELGPLMDSLIGESNVKQRQGAIGVFTGGLISRTDSLESAVVLALCRTIAPQYYGE
jgi:inosine/xanthosine triphosphatase